MTCAPRWLVGVKGLFCVAAAVPAAPVWEIRSGRDGRRYTDAERDRTEQPLVQRPQLVGHRLLAEALGEAAPAFLAEAHPHFRVARQRQDGCAQGVQILSADQHAGLTVEDDLAGAIDIVADGRPSHDQGLRQHAGQPFAQTGMDHGIHAAEQLRNPPRRHQAGEVDRVAHAQSLGLGLQPIAPDAAADPDEPHVRILSQHLGRDRQDVVVPLALEEAGDGRKRHLAIGQPELAADLVARASRVQEGVHVHAAVDGRILLGTSHARRQRLLGHGIADADDRMTPPRCPAFEHDI